MFCFQPWAFKELKFPFCTVRKWYKNQNFLEAFGVWVSLLSVLNLLFPVHINLLLSCFFVLVCWPEHWHAFCDAWQTRSHLIREQKIYHSSPEIVASYRGTKRFFWFTVSSWQSYWENGTACGWRWVRPGVEVKCSWGDAGTPSLPFFPNFARAAP